MQLCPNCNHNNRDIARYCAQCQTQLLGLLGANAMLENRYQVQKILGCGGMGAVYLAEDTRLGGKKVALKENFDISPEAKSQFQREAETLAHLSHLNLPTVNDHFIGANNRPYFVMTYVEGQSLYERLEQANDQPLPEADVLAWADQLLSALAYCHQNNVIHRDIKPLNIIIQPDGQAMLVDFGLVKIYDQNKPETTGMTGMGSPQYAPLEQFEFTTEHTEARSDLYSLGVTLYHSLTGQVPPMALDRKANPDLLSPPRQLNSNLSASVETAILKAIALPLAKRFQSADEMRQALQPAAKPALPPPPAASPAPPPPPTASPAPPPPPIAVSPWVWISAGAAVLMAAVLLVLLIGSWLFGDSTTPAVGLPPAASIPTNTPTAIPISPTKVPTNQPTITPSPTVTSTPIPPQPGEVSRDNKGISMVYVPAGPFKMGGNADVGLNVCQELCLDCDCQRSWFKAEEPVHTVTLDAFYIDQYEVTNARYRKCVEANFCRVPDCGELYSTEKTKHPVVCVSWNEAKKYCEWRGIRLPTEAEWEKAARGVDGRTYPWGEGSDCNQTNYRGKDGSCVKDTTPVGTYPNGVSPYNVYDMAGNVQEWVQSEYQNYPYTVDDGRESLTSTNTRVLRGGYFDSSDVRTSYRGGYEPVGRAVSIGFRCASSGPP